MTNNAGLAQRTGWVWFGVAYFIHICVFFFYISFEGFCKYEQRMDEHILCAVLFYPEISVLHPLFSSSVYTTGDTHTKYRLMSIYIDSIWQPVRSVICVFFWSRMEIDCWKFLPEFYGLGKTPQSDWYTIMICIWHDRILKLGKPGISEFVLEVNDIPIRLEFSYEFVRQLHRQWFNNTIKM